MFGPLFTYLSTAYRHRYNTWMSRETLNAIRISEFRSLVRHAQAHSPYYARIMDEHGIDAATCLPTDFPVLSKRQLMENFDDIVTDRRISKAKITEFLQHSRDPEERFLDHFHVLHSSGSSGEVGIFVFSPDDWMRGMACAARIHPPAMRRTKVAFYGATGGHFAGVSFTLTGRTGVAAYFFDVATFEINTPLAETLAGLNAFQPDILFGYATGHKILARAQLDGRLQIQPELVESGGEPLCRGDQAWLEEVFGCPCINVYGTSEHMLLGMARLNDPGMTLFDDDLIIEPAGDDVLVTNLFNRTLPLIRYSLSDTLRFMDVASPYGPYPVIEPVVGRNESLPTFRNAAGEQDFISPHVINEIFVPGVWRFQLRCINESSFSFAICLDEELDKSKRAGAKSAIKARLQEILVQKGLENVKFKVDVVKDIPIDPISRKFRLVLPVGKA